MAIENQSGTFEPGHRCNQLEANELTIGTNLSATDYSELLLIYLIQQKLIKAKFCYMRAIEKYERDNLIRQIWTFAEHVCKQNNAEALKILKVNNTAMDQPILRPYVEELERRLTACQLRAVAKSYSLISISKLAQLLGMEESSAQLQELLQKCAWNSRIDNDFIRPTETDNEEFTQTIKNMQDPRYGEMTNKDDSANSMECPTESSNLDVIKSLVDSSIFFDSMSVPSAVEGSAQKSSSSNDQNN